MHLGWLTSGAALETGTAALSPSSIFWRVLGAVALGVVLARWSWILFAPQATVVAVVPEHGTTVEAALLFGKAVSAVAASGASTSEGEALPNVHLVGVFAARMGQPGFAVLKLDEKHQVGVVVGADVVSGIKLKEVHPNYVLLQRADVQQRVNLDEKTAAATGAGVK